MTNTKFSGIFQEVSFVVYVEYDGCLQMSNFTVNSIMNSSYTYTIGDPEMSIEDVADFSREGCQTEIVIAYNDTFDDVDFLSNLFTYPVDGRTYELDAGFTNRWSTTEIGSIPISIHTTDNTL